MKVLVACEESQEVCKAFRALGHEAYSCDLQDCSGGRPEWHLKQDVIPLLSESWDLIIAHPPCTYLTAASAVRLFNSDHSIRDLERERLGWAAVSFFNEFLNCSCSHVCIENPVPLKYFNLPKYSQIIEPFYFGDPWKKRTCLWLKGLPLLSNTHVVEPLGLWVGSTSCRDSSTSCIKSSYSLPSHRDSKVRSKTFPGIARAMAEQWSSATL